MNFPSWKIERGNFFGIYYKEKWFYLTYSEEGGIYCE